MATLYRTDGTKSRVKPSNGTDFSLEELQSFVGGYIEIAIIDDQHMMVFNEEGKLLRLEPNFMATVLFRKAFGGNDMIVGNALVCKEGEVK